MVYTGSATERFDAFAVRYRDELATSEAAAVLACHCREVADAGDRVILLYAACDPQVNHALVLKAWLEEQAVS